MKIRELASATSRTLSPTSTYLEVSELDGEVLVSAHPRDHELDLPGVWSEPVANIDADPLDHQVDQPVDLGVEVGPVVDDVDVGVVPPGLHGLPVPVPGQLDPLEPGGVVLGGVELLRPVGGALQVDDVVVAVVADLDLLQPQLAEDLVPGLLRDEGGGVHDAPVGDDEDVLAAFLCHGEVSVLQRHHGAHQVLLEVQDLGGNIISQIIIWSEGRIS